MTDWKKDIKTLAKDFCISQKVVNTVLKQAEANCLNRQLPSYYNGDMSEYLYDHAQRALKNIILYT